MVFFTPIIIFFIKSCWKPDNEVSAIKRNYQIKISTPKKIIFWHSGVIKNMVVKDINLI